MKLFYLRQYLSTSLWFIPALFVVGAIALGIALPEVDARVQSEWVERVTFKGDAENARTFLATISSPMIAFTGLVFTITIVVLQLASQQFSPRVLRTFLKDRQSQTALGVFVATFVYATVVLRGIPSVDAGPQAVPNISITVGFVFMLLSLAVFISYIHHIAQSIRVPQIIKAIAGEASSSIAHIYGDSVDQDTAELPRSDPTQVLAAPEAGVVTALDLDALTEAARRSECVLEVLPAVGDFIPEGRPLLKVYNGRRPVDERVLEHVGLGPERTMEQDPAFGFRQLVDIAQKALSPALNDPTTAVQAIDAIHDLLRKLATSPFPSGQRLDADGNLRLIFPVWTWDSYVSLACLELRHYGEGSIQVIKRMRAMLEDLREVAPSERVGPIEKQLKLLDAALERAWPDLEDRYEGAAPDEQGMGD